MKKYIFNSKRSIFMSLIIILVLLGIAEVAVARITDAQRDEVLELFLSTARAEVRGGGVDVRDAVWATDTFFRVGVINDTGNYRMWSAYASSVCYELEQYGFKGEGVWVSVWDWQKLISEGEWVRIGDWRCDDRVSIGH